MMEVTDLKGCLARGGVEPYIGGFVALDHGTFAGAKGSVPNKK